MSLTTRDIALTGVMAALAVGMGYAFIFVPNLEMVSATVFISGYLLGVRRGVLVGAVGETVYTAFNPMGSSLGLPPLMAAQVIGMCIFGVMGGVAGRLGERFSFDRRAVAGFAAAGFTGTVIFDLLTSLAWPLAAGFEGGEILATLAIGAFFYWVHIISNTLIFAIAVPTVLKSVYRTGKFS